MNIKTKFDLDQQVYFINPESNPINIPCPYCEGQGEINTRAGKMRCGKCFGKKFDTVGYETTWKVCGPTKICKVSIDRNADCYKFGCDDRTVYMLLATGFPSGTLWDEQSVYATLEEAKTACAEKNRLEAEKAERERKI